MYISPSDTSIRGTPDNHQPISFPSSTRIRIYILSYQPSGFLECHCYSDFWYRTARAAREAWCTASSRTTVSALDQSSAAHRQGPRDLRRPILWLSLRPFAESAAVDAVEYCWERSLSLLSGNFVVAGEFPDCQPPRRLSGRELCGVADLRIFMLTDLQCRI
jgi:hypothetical protein